MSSLRSVLSLALFITLLGPCLSSDVSPSNDQTEDPRVDIETFNLLLNQADHAALHAALHDFSPKKFQHGMFPEDRTAVEAIHREEPGVATGILKLAKRQTSNATIASPNQQTTSRVLPSPIGPETNSAESQITSETQAPSTPVSSVPVTTSQAPETTTGSPSTTNGQVVTTTDVNGMVVISTVGGGATTLSPSGQTTLTSQAPITSTMLRETSLANGAQSTITSVAVVGASETAETPTGDAGVASTTGTGQPGLQTGEATMTRGFGKEMAVVFGAAAGVAFLL